MSFRFEAASEAAPQSPESPVPGPEAADKGLELDLPGPWNGIGCGHVSGELQDALDRQCVPCELIAHWTAKERKALPPASGSPLPAHVRDIALRFMVPCVQLMSLPPTSWFHAAVLLDSFCARAPRGVSVELLPATCLALVKMLKKVDQASLCMRGSNLSSCAVHFVHWLRASGYPGTADPTEEQLAEAERAVLEVLNWEIDVPSLESWTSLFCTRFNVLTRGHWLPSLQWVWQQSSCHQRLVVLQQAAGAELRPKCLAAGLLGLAFVSARLLTLDELRPPKASAEDWEQLFLQGQLQSSAPSCILAAEHAQRVLQLLQAATGLPLAELREACAAAAGLLRDALQAARRPQERLHTSL